MFDISEEMREKLINYFGDDKPRTPKEFMKAALDLKIPIPLAMYNAAKRVFGESFWKDLGGEPEIREGNNA